MDQGDERFFRPELAVPVDTPQPAATQPSATQPSATLPDVTPPPSTPGRRLSMGSAPSVISGADDDEEGAEDDTQETGQPGGDDECEL